MQKCDRWIWAAARRKCGLELFEPLYYKIITELMEEQVENDAQFFGLLREFSKAKKAYDKLKDAMKQVEENGYGIVEPKLHEMTVEEPEVFKQGDKYGVKITLKRRLSTSSARTSPRRSRR